MLKLSHTLTSLAAMGLLTSGLQAGFYQGFETDTAGWFDSDDFAGYGDITRVPSGTDSIPSAEGLYHAIATSAPYGPFTRFGGYSDTWPGGYTATVMIYLDLTMALGEGFDYSVAANGSDGSHQRDFIFHVTKDTSTGNLLVGASNNSNYAPREDLENINNYVVGDSAWYEFQHVFRDDAGVLAVDMNLFDSNGNLLFTETRTNASDVIATEIGGNRYGFFTDISVTGGIAIDNVQLSVVPEPSMAIFGLTGLGLGLLILRRRR